MKGKSIYILGCIGMIIIFLLFTVGTGSLSAQEILPRVFQSDPSNMAENIPVEGRITIIFISIFNMNPVDMDPDTTKAAFHIYADMETDLKGNGILYVSGNILTFDYSGLDYKTTYNVRIDSTATDMEGRSLDGNEDQISGQGEDDNWVMRFTTVEEPILPPPPVAGYTGIFRSGEMISSLTVDNEDNLWVGTRADGGDEGEIWYFTGRTWINKTPSINSQLTMNSITSLLMANDQIWAVFDISGESDPNLQKKKKKK